MKIKWKLFRESFPYVCTKCGVLGSMEREYCESCGAEGGLRKVKKEDYSKYLTKIS